MARIRTIKPEFPQSESMGRVSRDARLLFVMLWTICDDAGRARAASRMLASLLFPYDDDAPKLIDGWLDELEREHCIVRYTVDGSTYLQVCKWLSHQKIDRPSKSQFPDPREDSRGFARIREGSSEDQGPRTKDQGKDQGPKIPPSADAGASLPEDPLKLMIDGAITYLGDCGVAEKQARSVIGMTRKSVGDVVACELLTAMQQQRIANPVAWLRKAIEARGPPGRGKQSALEIRNRQVAQDWVRDYANDA
jgi:hypothetical protein